LIGIFHQHTQQGTFSRVRWSKFCYIGSIPKSTSVEPIIVTCFSHATVLMPTMHVIPVSLASSRQQGTPVFRHLYFTRYCGDTFSGVVGSAVVNQ